MMNIKKTFTYQNAKIIILWGNDAPFFIDYEYNDDKIYIQKETTDFFESFIVGVELLIHKGGRICYGFLAAQVNPSTVENQVNITFAFTQKNSVKYKDSCCADDAFIYKGLPKEYLLKIEETVMEFFSKKEVWPKCSIDIKYAANCEVGSNPKLFCHIAKILLSLICYGSLEEILKINAAEFAEKYLFEIH